MFVVWTRLLRDDGVPVRLNSIGADSLGRAGLAGRVDKKFRERFRCGHSALDRRRRRQLPDRLRQPDGER
ncbi:TrbI/VirB10 family protein [Aminobacter aganoensis]|uniref:TrbI/VirB10 family protein n=1 Tax=Aminobacter aganoensis TaxID=83264 RepID=UPI0031EE8ABC